MLDIGCGTGWWLERLVAQGHPTHELWGIDLSPERVGTARSRAPGANLRAGDAQALPFGDERFGLVLLMLVLSSLPDAGAVHRALAEARRVTAPNGAILIWEPRLPNPLNTQTRLIRRRTLRRELGSDLQVRSITLLPQLARRLGTRTDRWYSPLARIPALRTHRLVFYRRLPTVP